MSSQELFTTDEKICKLTEEKKEVMKQKHRKKLTLLKNKKSICDSEPMVITDSPIKKQFSSHKKSQHHRNNRYSRTSKISPKKCISNDKRNETKNIPEKTQSNKDLARNH